MKELGNEIINPALMLAVSRMKENNNLLTQNKLAEEALRAKFLVPCKVQMKPGTEQEANRTPKNTSVQFNLLKTTEGDIYFMAFSDMGELKKWQDIENQNVMVMGFDDLAGLVLNENSNAKGFVLNPVTSNVVFQKQLISNIIINRDRAAQKEKDKELTPGEHKEEQKKDEKQE